jgi:hypothetical protein
MAKPKAIQWLEDETGQTIDFVAEPSPAGERHRSVRLPDDLALGLCELAVERGLSVSQLVRQLLGDAVAQRQAVAFCRSRRRIRAVDPVVNRSPNPDRRSDLVERRA